MTGRAGQSCFLENLRRDGGLSRVVDGGRSVAREFRRVRGKYKRLMFNYRWRSMRIYF